MFVIGFGCFSAVHFTRHFLQTETNTPILNKILIVIAAGGLVVMGMSLNVPFQISVKAANLIGLLSVVFAIFTGIVCLKKKYLE